MKWFDGNIAQAVNLSKQRNSIFVVYVEGNDEMSIKLRQFIEEDRIRTKLESEHFVAIRIESSSESYIQFAQIYQLVPVPSIFFVGKNGAPIQVVTGVVASVDDLEEKIKTVLETVGIKEIAPQQQTLTESSSPMPKEAPGTSASQAFISGEQTSSTADTEIVCEGDVCYRRPKVNDAEKPEAETSKTPTTTQKPEPVPVPESAEATTASKPEPKPDAPAEAVEQARKLIEEKRKQREEEEKRLERERELRRRREGQEMLNFKQQQREQELAQMKENIRRDKLEEQAARQRILEKIASDRAEQAKKFAMPSTPAASAADQAAVTQPVAPPAPSLNNSEFSRIQFRRPEGETSTHTFKSSEKFQVVRDHVRSTILSNAGIRDFSLATTFPRREFTIDDDAKTLNDLGLCPSAVLLVIAPQRSTSGPAAIVARSGGFVNVFNSIFWGLLSPIFAVFGYVRQWFTGGDRGNSTSTGTTTASSSSTTTGAQKRANEESMADNDAAKRRNLDRLLNRSFMDDASSTSKLNEPKKDMPYRRIGGSNVHRLRENKDSDDENNTWNGNSTQQQ